MRRVTSRFTLAKDDLYEQKIQNLEQLQSDKDKSIPPNLKKFFVGDFDVEQQYGTWRTVSTSTKYNQNKLEDVTKFDKIWNKANVEIKNKFEVLAKLKKKRVHLNNFDFKS
eukprot:TRINITY_DN15579_c0_g1_i1.p2 TRINITY_DN15579_c0_g1~~TRINITY_DN15579_c0_g1_i1.p2  ORF type:complete len:111 (+),score=6.28 TRINITY_DN15579_c0_g1_i1:57-389(+)